MADLRQELFEANTIEVEIKNVYGNERIYIVSKHGEAVKRLTGQETISRNHIKALESLGFIFKVATPKL